MSEGMKDQLEREGIDGSPLPEGVEPYDPKAHDSLIMERMIEDHQRGMKEQRISGSEFEEIRQELESQTPQILDNVLADKPDLDDNGFPRIEVKDGDIEELPGIPPLLIKDGGFPELH